MSMSSSMAEGIRELGKEINKTLRMKEDSEVGEDLATVVLFLLFALIIFGPIFLGIMAM